MCHQNTFLIIVVTSTVRKQIYIESFYNLTTWRTKKSRCDSSHNIS